MTPLTKKEEKKHNKQKVCHIYKNDLVPTIAIINTIRLEIIVTILENTAAHDVCNLRYKIPKEFQ